eukprot:2126864-Alexandrium_andersonii.AAC.1
MDFGAAHPEFELSAAPQLKPPCLTRWGTSAGGPLLRRWPHRQPRRAPLALPHGQANPMSGPSLLR